MRWVGRPLPRCEDSVLLRGRGRYTADLARGARRWRFVRSPVARGRSPLAAGTALRAPNGVRSCRREDLTAVKTCGCKLSQRGNPTCYRCEERGCER
jgi:hypothetical protein